jgi:hypothetical protein
MKGKPVHVLELFMKVSMRQDWPTEGPPHSQPQLAELLSTL